jgi:hypothetical protein
LTEGKSASGEPEENLLFREARPDDAEAIVDVINPIIEALSEK